MRRSTPVGSRGARARGCRAGYQVRLPLELQSGFAGGGSDRRDAPVVEVAATVEDDLVDTGGLGPLGQEGADLGGRVLVAGGARSEEHTSELQSLMRISYAVFCLKKKKPNTRTHS